MSGCEVEVAGLSFVVWLSWRCASLTVLLYQQQQQCLHVGYSSLLMSAQPFHLPGSHAIMNKQLSCIYLRQSGGSCK